MKIAEQVKLKGDPTCTNIIPMHPNLLIIKGSKVLENLII